MSIDFSASDPAIAGYEDQTSGILKIQFRLDGGEWVDFPALSLPPPLTPPQAGGESDEQGESKITVSSERLHTLDFYSIDRAGNREEAKTVTFTIDKTPPEAVIQFDPQKKDLAFAGTDNFSLSEDITLTDTDDTVTLTDQAGNTTELKLKDKNRKIKLKTEIKSLSYNGQPADLARNKLSFHWLYDRKGNLKFLSQLVSAKNGFNLLATYTSDKTLLLGRDQDGRILDNLDGLVLLKITTNKGDLVWGY